MTTTLIAFPDIEGTFQAACSEVLSPFFSNGWTGTINNETRQVMQAEVHYNIDKVQPSTKPRFCLVGTRSVDIYNSKCKNDFGLLRSKKISLRKTAYLSIPRQGPLTVNAGDGSPKKFEPSWNFILRSWSEFLLIFSTQQRAFRLRGIMNPRLAFTPVQGSDKEFLFGVGSFDCNVEFSYQEE